MAAISSYNPVLLRLISFVFVFVQSVIGFYFQRTFSFVRTFSNNLLDIPSNQREKLCFPSNFLKKQSILAPFEPKNLKNSSLQDECEETPFSSDILICKRQNHRKLPEYPQQTSIYERSNSHLWLKIKEIAHDKVVEEPKLLSFVPEVEIPSEPRRKDHMSSTAIKLDDYNRVNREYFYRKYHSGVEIDDYSFTHPSAKSVYSRSLLIPSANLWKGNKLRISKRKPSVFKPTALSTIFENLAY